MRLPRNVDRWIGSYLFTEDKKVAWQDGDDLDIYIAICDHWEPECYGASYDEAVRRVHRWRDEYPRLFEQYRDVDGKPPQYTFFFPQDEYHPRYLDDIRPVCEAGFGDVDVHLHHDNDTAEQLWEKLESFRETLFHTHGLLRKDPITGEIVYGFIHGNWALCNSLPDGSLCGVNDELTVLRETGCYADFTLPSAPSQAQIPTINSIYYAKDISGQCASHAKGIRARAGQLPPDEHLLMIQGPLTLDWSRFKKRLMPGIENGDVHGGRPATLERLKLWIQAGVYVAGQPNHRFIKLYSHGCKDDNIDTLLGKPMQDFYASLEEYCREYHNLRVHYVTAWEMAQKVHELEQPEIALNMSKKDSETPVPNRL